MKTAVINKKGLVPVQKVAIVVNYRKQACLELADDLAACLRQHDVELFAPPRGGAFTVNDIDKNDFTGVDMAFVLGGDGTMLATGRAMALYGVPVLGVNLGRVGFLSELEPEGLPTAVTALKQGAYTVEERMMLQCAVLREDRQVDSCLAFNDVVVTHGMYARTVELELRVDDQDIHTYRGDGIIISTPTGSTGYSFSAGGPVVMPSIEVIVIVPICPHTFFSRPIVASPNSVVEVSYRHFDDSVILSADGQNRINIQAGDLLRVQMSERKAQMIRLGNGSPFAHLKRKIYQT